MNREAIETLLKDNGVAEDKIKAAVDTIMDTNGKDIEAEKAKAAANRASATSVGELPRCRDLCNRLKLQDDVL